jgi:hypothetical protein
MLKALGCEAQDPAHCPGWTCLSRKKDEPSVVEVGMRVKAGLVYQVWVSLEIWCLGNELSIGASEGQTVLLHWRPVHRRRS